MRPGIIQIVFTVQQALPCLDCLRDCVTKPGCCMDEGVLFMGDATLKKIFCLQDTLRGVGGRPPLTESLLQPERVLFLPSPLLREKTSATQRSGKQVRYLLTPPLFQLLIQTQAHIHSSVQEGLRLRLTSPLRKKSRKPYKSFKSTSSLEKWSRWIYWTYCWYPFLMKQKVVLYITISIKHHKRQPHSHSWGTCRVILFPGKEVAFVSEEEEELICWVHRNAHCLMLLLFHIDKVRISRRWNSHLPSQQYRQCNQCGRYWTKKVTGK